MALRLFDDDKAKEIYLAICAAYRRGGGQKEVAERYGCNPKTISDLFCHKKPYSFLATICQRCGERRWEIVMHQTEERVCWGCMLVARKEGGVVVSSGVCTICKKRPIAALGRCKPCYNYFKYHNRERPADLKVVRRKVRKKCITCGKRKAKAKGRCFLCYSYHRQYGKERPPSLDNKPQKPILCDCGSEAKHEVELSTSMGTHLYRLCDGCYQVECGD